MTECEKVICKMYLEDMHDNCNENRLLLQMLETEPCSDAISREEVLDLCDSKDPDYRVCHLKEDIECMPPVHAEPKTGHWIVDVDRWGDIVTTVNGYRCDKCNAFNTDKDNYCPNCGAQMVESEGTKDD